MGSIPVTMMGCIHGEMSFNLGTKKDSYLLRSLFSATNMLPLSSTLFVRGMDLLPHFRRGNLVKMPSEDSVPSTRPRELE